MNNDFLDVLKVEPEKPKVDEDAYYVLFTLSAGSVIQIKHKMTTEELDKLYDYYTNPPEDTWNKKLRIGKYDLVDLDSVISIQAISLQELQDEIDKAQAGASLLLPEGMQNRGPLQ